MRRETKTVVPAGPRNDRITHEAHGNALGREDIAGASSRQVRRADVHAAMTPERILALAAMPGGFRVSWHRRDEWILHRCAKLVRAGRLRRIRRCAKGAYFYGLPLAEPVA